MKRSFLGFTFVELLIVLAVIATLTGCLFPLGSVLKHRAHMLELKADGLRYQAAILNYFETYNHFPKFFPKDQWFDISTYSLPLITHFSGRKASMDNPDKIEFCEFSVQEWTSKTLPSIHFFLCRDASPNDAIHGLSQKLKIYGSRVLFCVNK